MDDAFGGGVQRELPASHGMAALEGGHVVFPKHVFGGITGASLQHTSASSQSMSCIPSLHCCSAAAATTTLNRRQCLPV